MIYVPVLLPQRIAFSVPISDDFRQNYLIMIIIIKYFIAMEDAQEGKDAEILTFSL